MKVVPTDTDGTTWNLNLGKEIPEEMRYMKWIKVDAEGSIIGYIMCFNLLNM